MGSHHNSPLASPSPPSSHTAPSITASPASQMSHLHPSSGSQGSDSQQSQSGAGTSQWLSALDTSRPGSTVTTARGGCWTCRIRRKKCDEQRENDACYTCRRLNIECLGWGPRRPDWMRDKKSVDAYKADIKAQLSRAGLIRGQPRLTAGQSAARPNTSSPPSYLAPLQSQSASNSNRPPPSVTRVRSFNGSANPAPYEAYPLQPQSYTAHELPDVSHIGSSSSNGLSVHRLPSASYSEPDLNSLSTFKFDTSYPFTPPIQTPNLPFTPLSGSAEFFPDPSHLHHGSTGFYEPDLYMAGLHGSIFVKHSPLHASYLADFFSPRSHQDEPFVLASPYVLETLLPLVQQYPHSVLSHSVCAIAALVRWNKTRDAADESASRQLHESAIRAINSRRNISDMDAIGIAVLTIYSSLLATTSWKEHMNLLYDWFVASGVPVASSPSRALSGMSPAGQCCFKLLVWIDVLSSLAARCSPRFMTTYRRLFPECLPAQNTDLEDPQRYRPRIDLVCGIDDASIFALAEIAALKEWKISESRKGALSIRDLVHRGDQIEATYKQHQVDLPTSWESAPLNDMTTLSNHKVSSVYTEFVNLALLVTMSDANPGVAEISSSIVRIQQSLELASDCDLSSVLLPIFIAGCIVRDPDQRRFFRTCAGSGNIPSAFLIKKEAVGLMDAVWDQVNTGNRPLDDIDTTMATRLGNVLLL